MKSYLDFPVFLCGHRKTGTTALLCLFDNHPELLTFPADSGFFYRVYPVCENLENKDIIERVIKYSINESLGPEGDAVGRLISSGKITEEEGNQLFDRFSIAEKYRSLINRNNTSSASFHLRSLIQSYGDHCGQDSSNWVGWMEKTTSTEIYATEVAEWFPNAKFIHLIRDPRDNYASLKSGWDARYQDWENTRKSLLQSLFDRGGLGLRIAKLNQKVIGKDRYKIIRFEDLASNPIKYMSDLTKFIGISENENLLEPTVNGQPWPGNNFDGLEFKGLSSVNIGKWTTRIEPWEAALIEGHLGQLMEDFDYKISSSESEQVKACIDHYKWFNFLPKETRGEV